MHVLKVQIVEQEAGGRKSEANEQPHTHREKEMLTLLLKENQNEVKCNQQPAAPHELSIRSTDGREHHVPDP